MTEQPNGSSTAGVWEASIRRLLVQAQTAAPHRLPSLIAAAATEVGLGDALIYLVDLQQNMLVPFVAAEAQPSHQVVRLDVDSTLAGRAFQHGELLTQAAIPGGGTRVWLPLLEGAERLGVLAVTVDNPASLDEQDAILQERLAMFATLCAKLLAVQTVHSDTIVTLRRTAQMGLAAEMQWALLPPLTFSCRALTVAGALEPAYSVAGDALDYAVDDGSAQMAIFDGMGHGLRSAQLATTALAAYRNSRRAGRPLPEQLAGIDEAVHTLFAGAAFITAVLCELDTITGRFSWVNAGHPPPLLLRPGRPPAELDLRPMLPLGLAEDLRFDDQRVVIGSEQLQPGDRVLLYTDGITEARSPDGKFYGEAALTDLLTSHLSNGLSAAETMRRVTQALLEYQQGQLADDATLLLVHWHGHQPAP